MRITAGTTQGDGAEGTHGNVQGSDKQRQHRTYLSVAMAAVSTVGMSAPLHLAWSYQSLIGPDVPRASTVQVAGVPHVPSGLKGGKLARSSGMQQVEK